MQIFAVMRIGIIFMCRKKSILHPIFPRLVAALQLTTSLVGLFIISGPDSLYNLRNTVGP